MAAVPREFASKIEVASDSECWNWTAAKDPSGYGAVKIRGKKVGAHRAVFEASGGRIPDGFWIDHLCRNRACVNPEHLERATCQREQRRASAAKMRALGATY